MIRALVVLALLVPQARPRPSLADLDAHRTELRSLLDAIRAVESGHDDKAVGDGGLARGPYQIHEGYLTDAKDWCTALVGGHEDCHQRRFAERVMVAYWDRYVPTELRDRDHQVLARVHNGGPRGHKKKATLAYWEKVRACL